MSHSQSPKTTPPKTDPAKRPDEDESGKSPQTTPSNVAVVSPMPSLKKQKMQKAAAAAQATTGEAEEKEKLNNSVDKVSALLKITYLKNVSFNKFTTQAQIWESNPAR